MLNIGKTMKKKEVFKNILSNILVITSVMFLLIACHTISDSGDINPPDGPHRPIVFNETEKSINYESQSVSFIADRTDFWIPVIWVTIGTEIISETFTYDERNQQIKGDWYTIKVENNTIKVDIDENNSDNKRTLIINALTQVAYQLLTIKQTTK